MVFRSIPSVRARLSFLVSVCVLPLTLLVGLIVIDNFDRERDQLVDSNVLVARTISSLVDQEISSTIATLNALATSPLLETADWAAFHRQASAVARKAGIASLVLSDESGTEIANTLRPFGAPLPRIGAGRTLQLLREANGPTISPLYFDPLSNEDVVAVSVPVRIDGKAPHILSAVLRPARFAEILHQQSLPPDWIVAVVNGQNRFVARSHNMKEYLGKPAVPALAAALAFDNEGSLETRTTEGVAVLGMFSRSATSNWTVAIGVPRRVLTADLHRRLLLLVSVLVAVLAASLALARSTAGKISGSIRNLVAPALALGDGEAPRIPPMAMQEANEVAEAIRRAAERLRRSHHEATHDALTGLSNRVLFEQFLEQQIALCKRNRSQLSVMCLDLDGFKAVNDRLGHAAGDAVLAEVARRLKSGIRESDLAARIGGDEFAVALVATGSEGALVLAEKLIDALSASYAPITDLPLSASVGVASYPGHGEDLLGLLKFADAAMYQAKTAGKRQARVA